MVIKEVKKKNLTPFEAELQLREMEVLKLAKSPNIVKLYDIFENDRYIYIGKPLILHIPILIIYIQ